MSVSACLLTPTGARAKRLTTSMDSPVSSERSSICRLRASLSCVNAEASVPMVYPDFVGVLFI